MVEGPGAIIRDQWDQHEIPASVSVAREREEEIVGEIREDQEAKKENGKKVASLPLPNRFDQSREEQNDAGRIAEKRGGPSVIAAAGKGQGEVSRGWEKEGKQTHEFAAGMIADHLEGQREKRAEIMGGKRCFDRGQIGRSDGHAATGKGGFPHGWKQGEA